MKRIRFNRNWFYTLAVFILIDVLFLAMAFVMHRLGDGKEYPYFLKGVWFLGILILALILTAAAKLYARFHLSSFFTQGKRSSVIPEGILASALLAAGLILRIWYVGTHPMKPASDYKTYYEVAQLIMKGTLLTDGPGYCDYIAMFPHVYGYPFVLSMLFRMTGVSVAAGVYFNVVLAVGTVFFCWRIARLAAGRKAGLAALVIADFWPSMILYNNFLAGEYLFTFLLAVCIWIFSVSLKNTAFKQKHAFARFWELALLGLSAAIAGAVRPMALLFLISAILLLLMYRPEISQKPANDVPLGIRAVNRGWKMALIVLLVYLSFSKIFSASVAYAIDEKPAGGSASFGYNLLVGLNQESYGGWNQEDADFLYEAFDKTGSAQEAQIACRDEAVKRLKTDPKALLNLFIHKFQVLWGDDDYGASWNILFGSQQKTVTEAGQNLYNHLMDIGNLYYLTVLALALLSTVYLWKKGPGFTFSLQLMLLATAALHLLVENQNRYHFHALLLLAILAGIAVGNVFEAADLRVNAALHEKAERETEKQEADQRIQERLQEEAEIQEMRANALHAQFDMKKAIREGHVHVTVSDAVRKAAENGEYESEEDLRGTKE